MNETNQQLATPRTIWLRVVVNTLICLAILAAAVYAVVLINRSEPTAQKLNATRKSAALVETLTVQRGTFSPSLVVMGTVESAQRIRLRPQVSGQVTQMSSEFVPGGMVQKGELLLRIDPADFENAVSISKSELKQTEASMDIEEARQRLAEKELKLLEGSIDETNRGLVLREPQIASIKAEVSAATAAVERAQLNLDRTYVYAPFDAQVLSRSVNVGSQVGLGDELGQLIGLDEYWVMAAVPRRHLRWVQFPSVTSQSLSTTNDRNGNEPVDSLKRHDDEDAIPIRSFPGSKVKLRDPDVWGEGVEREAHVSRLIGALDQQTRLARVLITVTDPLGLYSEAPLLILDTLIETEIEGRPIKNVFRLNREYVRDQDTVWVMNDNKLEIRQTEIVFRDATYAYIREGLKDGDRVVTTTLATVAEGVGLREATSSSDNGQSTNANRAETQ